MPKDQLKEIRKRLLSLEIEKKELLGQLKKFQNNQINCRKDISNREKIVIFKKLFKGREDIFAKRWDSKKNNRSGYTVACANEWKFGLCKKPKIKCGNCRNRIFLPLTDQVIASHLRGDENAIGIYPLLLDEKCWFLAVDFDKKLWKDDAKAFLKMAKLKNIHAYLERSRSGNGCHVWIFFKEKISALKARKLGSYLLTQTMKIYPDIGFDSYDRFFPNQDTMPLGGFGNLIALPLQRIPRNKENSVFLDNDFNPYKNQWEFFDSIKRVSLEKVDSIIGKEEDLFLSPKKKENFVKTEIVFTKKTPKILQITLSDQCYIKKRNLTPAIIVNLMKLASFINPEFYKAQAMRLSTYGKPRIISCVEKTDKHLILPIGCLDEVKELTDKYNIILKIEDLRFHDKKIETRFLGILRKDQSIALKELLKHETGVLSATTGFGKTVLAIKMIDERKCNTLILVHRRQLLDQWIARLNLFLDTQMIEIGRIGGGVRKPSNQIDVCTIQSLIKKNKVDKIVENYGQVIVDECHHISAFSFESVIKKTRAKYILGLTATPIRKDGHHPIIFMQCGKIRYNVVSKDQARKRLFCHYVLKKKTPFPALETKEELTIQKIYKSLILNKRRNNLIVNNILSSLEQGRSPVVLTERKEHLIYLKTELKKCVKNLIVLQGGLGVKKYKEIMHKLSEIPENEERLILATGRFLGEGFDDSRLDTLFLTMPISWKGTLIQYVGRLHRSHHNKKNVLVYDYVDENIPVLNRMFKKRLKGYKDLGYEILSDFNSESLFKG